MQRLGLATIESCNALCDAIGSCELNSRQPTLHLVAMDKSFQLAGTSQVSATDGENLHVLFNFLEFKKVRSDEGDARKILNLQYMADLWPDQTSPEQQQHKVSLINMLLRVQISCITDCVFERLRSPSTVSWALKMLPRRLRSADFAEQKKW